MIEITYYALMIALGIFVCMHDIEVEESRQQELVLNVIAKSLGFIAMIGGVVQIAIIIVAK